MIAEKVKADVDEILLDSCYKKLDDVPLTLLAYINKNRVAQFTPPPLSDRNDRDAALECFANWAALHEPTAFGVVSSSWFTRGNPEVAPSQNPDRQEAVITYIVTKDRQCSLDILAIGRDQDGLMNSFSPLERTVNEKNEGYLSSLVENSFVLSENLHRLDDDEIKDARASLKAWAEYSRALDFLCIRQCGE